MPLVVLVLTPRPAGFVESLPGAPQDVIEPPVDVTQLNAIGVVVCLSNVS